MCTHLLFRRRLQQKRRSTLTLVFSNGEFSVFTIHIYLAYFIAFSHLNMLKYQFGMFGCQLLDIDYGVETSAQSASASKMAINRSRPEQCLLLILSKKRFLIFFYMFNAVKMLLMTLITSFPAIRQVAGKSTLKQNVYVYIHGFLSPPYACLQYCPISRFVCKQLLYLELKIHFDKFCFSKMSQIIQEKKLLITYSLCTVLGAVASITTGIAWGHWKTTLDQCVNGKNCSCILYGQHTPTKFLGGGAAPCIWVTFGPLFYILFTIAMSCFHGYRVLFSSRTIQTRTMMSKNVAGEMVEMRAVRIDDTNPLPKSYWLTLAVLTSCFAIYSLVHFSIFVDGFYQTCNQYRKTLEKLLGVLGTAIPVVHRRLSCQSVFDFMDYMQPNSGYGFREGFIYTGADLVIGIVAACFAWILFAYAAFINVASMRSVQIEV